MIPSLTRGTLLGFCLSFTLAFGQVVDPVPSIQPSPLTFQLEDFLTIPNSNSGIPRARINLLKELPDGSGRLFVNDLNGPGHLIHEGTSTEYLDLNSWFPNFVSAPGKGTGFGSFAFHPEFGSNGIFYTAHAESPGSGTVDFAPEYFQTIALEWVLEEWTATNPAADTFAGSHREVLRFSFPHSIHNLQDLAFSPLATPDSADYGLLYLCVGEGGSMQKGFEGNLQHPLAYQGTIFRIYPQGSNGINGQYGIPPDNPFAQQPNALGEVWCSGFRNPHRISWDLGGNHKFLIGDIGEANIEEVNLGVPGANYGWSQREGTWVYDASMGRENLWPLPADDSGYVYPVAQYDHDDGRAVVGGYVYRGQTLPTLVGQYICGDIANGRVFHAPVDSLILGRQYPLLELQLVEENGQPTTVVNELPGDRADLRFGQDRSGEIYLLTKTDGKIRKLTSFGTTSVEGLTVKRQQRWYPNPSRGKLVLDLEGSPSGQPLSVQVYGLEGRLLLEGHSPELEIGFLPEGLYVIRWSLAGGIPQWQQVQLKE